MDSTTDHQTIRLKWPCAVRATKVLSNCVRSLFENALNYHEMRYNTIQNTVQYSTRIIHALAAEWCTSPLNDKISKSQNYSGFGNVRIPLFNNLRFNCDLPF